MDYLDVTDVIYDCVDQGTPFIVVLRYHAEALNPNPVKWTARHGRGGPIESVIDGYRVVVDPMDIQVILVKEES